MSRLHDAARDIRVIENEIRQALESGRLNSATQTHLEEERRLIRKAMDK